MLGAFLCAQESKTNNSAESFCAVDTSLVVWFAEGSPCLISVDAASFRLLQSSAVRSRVLVKAPVVDCKANRLILVCTLS